MPRVLKDWVERELGTLSERMKRYLQVVTAVAQVLGEFVQHLQWLNTSWSWPMSVELS